ATPPVGLWGELRKIARGRGSVARKRLTSSTRGRNACSTLKGASTARAWRRSRLGTYVGKCGLKTSTPSPGSSKASAKYCSSGFAPEATTTSFPSALSFRARASTENAVSAVKFFARALSRGMHGFLLEFLARRDHLRQRPDD